MESPQEFSHLLLRPLRHFAQFGGRSNLLEFWTFLTWSHLAIILLLVPAWFAFLGFASGMLEDVRVLAGIEGIINDPASVQAIWQEVLRPLVLEHADDYLANLWPAHAFALICTGISALLILLLVLPTLTLTVRRLRDAGKGFYWALLPFISLVPWAPCLYAGLVSALLLFIFVCLPSRPSLPKP